MESHEEKLDRVLRDAVEVIPYDPVWPSLFEVERHHLIECLPLGLVGRIEHFGSTAVPGLAAKPIIDMLVEVTSLEETRKRIVPILNAQGYDYFWRPTYGNDIPPWYAWFIRRDETGRRTHHIHMVESDFEHWDRLLFRDLLIACPDIAQEYAMFKKDLAISSTDRVAYTRTKGDYIEKITAEARRDRGSQQAFSF